MENLTRLGLDIWSITIYAANFGLLILIISYFFVTPLLNVMDKRRNTIKGNIKEAEKLKAELKKQKEQMDLEKEHLNQRMEEEMKNLQKSLDLKRKEAEEQIDMKKSKMLDEVKATIDSHKKALQKEVEAQTLELIQKIVLHIVSNKVSKDIVSESVEEAWKTYNK